MDMNRKPPELHVTIKTKIKGTDERDQNKSHDQCDIRISKIGLMKIYGKRIDKQ